MRRIKSISADLLAEKIKDASSQSDLESKKDVMSILVRARIADMAETEGYMMSDQAMMDQVLTFLGAGHETTASGLAWVGFTHGECGAANTSPCRPFGY